MSGNENAHPGPAAASFTELQTAHAELDEAFARHQELLVTGELDEAWRQLLRYRKRLIRHMKFEENELLPVYQRDPALPNGKPVFFLLDHRQILEQMDVLYDRYQELKRAADGERPRRLIALLDAETRYKNIVEHHETREERHLFPRLDQIATPEERARLLGALPEHLDAPISTGAGGQVARSLPGPDQRQRSVGNETDASGDDQ